MTWLVAKPFLAASVAVVLAQLSRLSTRLLDESVTFEGAWGEVFQGNFGPLATLWGMLSIFAGLGQMRKPTWLYICLGVFSGLFAFSALMPNWALSVFSLSYLAWVVLSILAILLFPGWNRIQGIISRNGIVLDLRRTQQVWAQLSRAGKVAVATLGSLAILVWQSTFLVYPPSSEPTYRLTASVGSVPMLANFVRTLYYSNYYPLAEIVLVGQGDEHQRSQWVTELGFSTRYGENGKAYLFLPHCYWKGNADSSSCRMSNVILFNAALIILFLNGCRLGYPTLAGIVVMLVGSNPFQVQEVQAHSNVFSWSISVAILALAMHLGYLLRPGPARVSAYLGAAGFGFLLATVRQVRTEPTVIMISVVAAILLNFKLRFRNRVALIVVLLGSLSLAQAGWKSYFAFKINQAEQVCRERGGVPYSGPRDDYHILWHPLWCGLGDYGQDRGYAWDDAAAWRYVQTILLKDYHISVNFDKSGYYLDSNWDNQPAYPRLLTEYPQCEPITRAKVVADIRENPVWYGIILLRRLNRVLRETTPIRLTWAERSLSLPFSGWICVPLLLLLAMARSRLGLLILFVAPTSMTSILVYSGRGTCLYSVFHILGAGLLLAFLLEALLQWKAPARGVA